MRIYKLEGDLRKLADQVALAQEIEQLKAQNGALMTELQAVKNVLAETQAAVEFERRDGERQSSLEAEVHRMHDELNRSNSQLSRSLAQIKDYEHQLGLFDDESKETLRKIRHLELENSSLQKKLVEVNKLLADREGEIQELHEELKSKNSFVQQVKAESQTVHAELEMLLRQKQELEGKVRIVENERDSIRAELDPTRRRILEATVTSPQTPGSPRSSMDLVESRLLRQMGNTTKQLEMLAKSNALSQSEKEHLQVESRRLANEIHAGLRTLLTIFERIVKFTGLKPTLPDDLTIDMAIEELAKIVEALLNDYDDVKRHDKNVTDSLRDAHEEIAQLKHNNDKLNERVRVAQEQLSIVEQEAEEARLNLEKQEIELSKAQKQLKYTQDVDMTRYREQIAQLSSDMATLEAELKAREERLKDAKLLNDSMRSRCAELELQLARVSDTTTNNQNEVERLRKERTELLARLATQEDLMGEASQKLEQVQQQLVMAERTKEALQETFQKELRSLNITNAELKAQLSSVSSGKSTNELRLERLQESLNSLQVAYEELHAKYQAKEISYLTTVKEREEIVLAKQALERELIDAKDTQRLLEGEVSRLKRADQMTRRGHEGLEHVQLKLEQANSLNSILKAQIETKEKALQESEDKLRRQDEAIRRAYADCDAQHQKIKKREMVINRVLKRLENINAISGLGEDEAVASLKNQGDEGRNF